MKTPGSLYVVAAATLGAAAYVYYTNTQAAAAGADPNAGVTLGGFDLTGMVTSMSSSFQNAFTSVPGSVSTPNMQAFLMMVRTGEGTAGPNGYSTLYGGGQFASFADHPNRAVTAGGYTSTAAGAYQILYSTWLEAKAALNLPDFSPASQDLAAVWLIQRRGALADVLNGAVDTAIGKCNKEWASLAGSPYGQPTRTLAQDETLFASNGGVQTDAGTGV